jgi:hypothetical protein
LSRRSPRKLMACKALLLGQIMVVLT